MKRLGGQYAGVYTVDGPAGVYVGPAEDCYERNEQLTKLGVVWRIVEPMPGSTKKARCWRERAVADRLAATGITVVSRNTTKAVLINHKTASQTPKACARWTARLKEISSK